MTTRLRFLVYYLVLAVLSVLIWTKHLADVLPSGLARQLGHNSEAYLLAFLLCAWIQWILPLSLRRRQSAAVAVMVGALSLILAIVLKETDIPITISTLNETFFALAFVLPYIHLRGRMPLAPVISAVVVIGLLAGHDTDIVVLGAEAWIVIVLVPLAFDVFDRRVLDNSAPVAHLRRLAWMAFLIVVLLLAEVLEGHLGHGHVEGIRDYIQRANEAFIALLLVHAFFAYWVPSTRPRPAPRG